MLVWHTQVFLHMKAANDSSCAPNVITYSALMTACCAGGRVDKAFEVFKSMKLDGVVPDHICYSTLIAGKLCCCMSCPSQQTCHRLMVSEALCAYVLAVPGQKLCG